MATNYSQAVVTELLPLTDFEEVLITAMGFTVDHYPEGCHIYAVDGFLDELFEEDLIVLCEDQGYSLDKELKKAGFLFRYVDIDILLQNALSRTPYKDVLIEVAYSCSKMRSGQFGGSVTRITRDVIQHASTFSAVDEWRNS